jgi:hypothetical protein
MFTLQLGILNALVALYFLQALMYAMVGVGQGEPSRRKLRLCYLGSSLIQALLAAVHGLGRQLLT